MNDAPQGVGAALPRKEDERYMRGRGRYIADIKPNGVRDVAFVRSPLAHARIRDIRIPPDMKPGLHRRGPQRRPRHSGRLRAARFQGIGTAHPCDRQGALCW